MRVGEFIPLYYACLIIESSICLGTAECSSILVNSVRASFRFGVLLTGTGNYSTHLADTNSMST